MCYRVCIGVCMDQWVTLFRQEQVLVRIRYSDNTHPCWAYKKTVNCDKQKFVMVEVIAPSGRVLTLREMNLPVLRHGLISYAHAVHKTVNVYE